MINIMSFLSSLEHLFYRHPELQSEPIVSLVTLIFRATVAQAVLISTY